MAAPAGNMARGCEDSSSSDEEALRRCQEAVWEARGDQRLEDGEPRVQQSKRVVVAEHEHDGNELQVTQGFRTHVAKKLGSLLDSCITETQTAASSCAEAANGGGGEDDEGFRLFSTSVPGQTAEGPPAPARRRPAPSSSDSDSEMETRLKEAAVSFKDLLPSPQSAPSTPSADTPKKKKKKKAAGGEESPVVKKEKKKKRRKQDGEESDSAGSRLNGEQASSEQEQVRVKQNKKKKKRREGTTEEEEEALN